MINVHGINMAQIRLLGYRYRRIIISNTIKTRSRNYNYVIRVISALTEVLLQERNVQILNGAAASLQQNIVNGIHSITKVWYIKLIVNSWWGNSFFGDFQRCEDMIKVISIVIRSLVVIALEEGLPVFRYVRGIQV